MTQRLAEFEAAKPAAGVDQPQRSYVMVSFFVAKTRREAHALARENWRDGDAEAGVAFIKSFGGDPSQPDFTTGATGWMMWDFEKAKTMCLYDEPAACVDYFQRLREALPSMYQCILEFNRRGRIPSEHVRNSMRLFADEVLPKLS